jgi:hypothetical protein
VLDDPDLARATEEGRVGAGCRGGTSTDPMGGRGLGCGMEKVGDDSRGGGAPMDAGAVGGGGARGGSGGSGGKGGGCGDGWGAILRLFLEQNNNHHHGFLSVICVC